MVVGLLPPSQDGSLLNTDSSNTVQRDSMELIVVNVIVLVIGRYDCFLSFHVKYTVISTLIMILLALVLQIDEGVFDF